MRHTTNFSVKKLDFFILHFKNVYFMLYQVIQTKRLINTNSVDQFQLNYLKNY